MLVVSENMQHKLAVRRSMHNSMVNIFATPSPFRNHYGKTKANSDYGVTGTYNIS